MLNIFITPSALVGTPITDGLPAAEAYAVAIEDISSKSIADGVSKVLKYFQIKPSHTEFYLSPEFGGFLRRIYNIGNSSGAKDNKSLADAFFEQTPDMPGTPLDYEFAQLTIPNGEDNSEMVGLAIPSGLFKQLSEAALSCAIPSISARLLSQLIYKKSFHELEKNVSNEASNTISHPNIGIILSRESALLVIGSARDMYSVDIDEPPRIALTEYSEGETPSEIRRYISDLATQIVNIFNQWNDLHGPTKSVPNGVFFGNKHLASVLERDVADLLNMDLAYGEQLSDNKATVQCVGHESIAQEEIDSEVAKLLAQNLGGQYLPFFQISIRKTFSKIVRSRKFLLQSITATAIVGMVLAGGSFWNEGLKLRETITKFKANQLTLETQIEDLEIRYNELLDAKDAISGLDLFANRFLRFAGFLEETMPANVRVISMSEIDEVGYRVELASQEPGALSNFLVNYQTTDTASPFILLVEDSDISELPVDDGESNRIIILFREG